MKRVPVCRAEFGLLVRWHVPWVHAMPGPKVVEVEEGNEALYPSATRWEVVPRGEDDKRRGMPGCRVPKNAPTDRFVPEPWDPRRLGPIGEPDVVVCPRRRGSGSAKNWPYWTRLTDLLQQDGHTVFAAGAPDSSGAVPCPAAWHYERFLDATIYAMLRARLVVATDAGLAHLAVLCGRPLLLITHNGLTAPGPVMDPNGRIMKPRYGPVKVEEHYRAANHTGSPIIECPAWRNPAAVAREAGARLS